MSLRLIELADKRSAIQELELLGCEPAGIKLMAPKALSRAIKLYNLIPTTANIIKQEMLSLGGDAATPAGAINHSAKKVDILVLGNHKQLNRLVAKLKQHQFSLPKIGLEIEEALENYDRASRPIKVGSKIFSFGKRTLIMGILNVTPDSFSDGGKFLEPKEALAQAITMIEAGADIIDVGGESTRPGAKLPPKEEELKRILPVVKGLVKEKVPFSIDTRKAEVAKIACAEGAGMVNDVSGLHFDPRMAQVVAQAKVPVCLMHMRGTPRTMQRNPLYGVLMKDVIDFLQDAIANAINAGILLEKIIVDPGIGFGKTVKHNLEILKKLKELKVLGRPIMVGPSRKSFIGQILDLPADERVEGTAAAVAVAVANGADIIRVHDVKEIKRVVKVADAIVRRR